MPDADFERCCFSARCCTDDLAIVHCLRALAQYAEKSEIPKAITWGGTKEADWRRDDNTITLRFTSAAFRSEFLFAAEESLRPNSWKLVATDDHDPAARQR